MLIKIQSITSAMHTDKTEEREAIFGHGFRFFFSYINWGRVHCSGTADRAAWNHARSGDIYSRQWFGAQRCGVGRVTSHSAAESAKLTLISCCTERYVLSLCHCQYMLNRDLQSFEIRFEFELAALIRLDSKVMSRIENFRIGRACLPIARRIQTTQTINGV